MVDLIENICIKNMGVYHSFIKMKPQLYFFLKKPQLYYLFHLRSLTILFRMKCETSLRLKTVII